MRINVSMIVIVLAAGSGNRLGLDMPKALVPLKGRPMIEWSINIFDKVTPDAFKILVVPTDYVKKLQKQFGNWHVIKGGRTRFYSLKGAVDTLKADYPENELVIVHDAARPNVSKGLISNLIDRANSGDYKCVVPAINPADSPKYIPQGGGDSSLTLAKNRVLLTQTPQVVNLKALKQGIKHVLELQIDVQDEAEIIERLGAQVGFIPGRPSNFKVTTEYDLKVMEFIMTEGIK